MEPGWRFLNSERVPVGPSNSIRRRAQRTERWSKKHLCLSVYSGRKVATAHDCQLLKRVAECGPALQCNVIRP